MTPRYFLYLFTFLASFAATPLLAQNTSELPIKVTRDRTLDNNLYGWGQNVEIEGVVKGDVGCLSGDVVISGTVEGNVNVLNGNIQLTKTAKITGNIVCLGGNVTEESGYQVKGRVLNYFKGRSAGGAATTSFKANAASFFAKSLLLFLLVIVLFYIFPNQISEASFQLSQHAPRSFFIGFITLAALIFLIFISLLLMVVVIGLPLLLLLLGIYMVMVTFGLVILFFRAAFAIRDLSGEKLSLVSCIFFVTIALLLLLQVPFVRGILVFAIITLGTGIVIETRFGTNKQWFTRKKRYWAAS